MPFTIRVSRRFPNVLASLAVPALTVGVAIGATHCATPYALPIDGMDAATTPPPSSSGGGDDTGTNGGDDATAQDGGSDGETSEASGDGAAPHGDAGEGGVDASGDAKVEGGSFVDCGACSTGCCDSNGTCQLITSTGVCGAGGSACVDCSQNTCAAGQGPCCKPAGGCGCAVLGLVACN